MLQDRFKMLVFVRLIFSPSTLAFCSSVHYIASPFHLIELHKCLECLDVRVVSMLDTHPLLLFYLFFYTRLLQSDVGAQEQEYPGDAYYDVEIPNDQEKFGGSQAGGLAFSICIVRASLLKANLYLVSVLRYYCFR